MGTAASLSRNIRVKVFGEKEDKKEKEKKLKKKVIEKSKHCINSLVKSEVFDKEAKFRNDFWKRLHELLNPFACLGNKERLSEDAKQECLNKIAEYMVQERAEELLCAALVKDMEAVQYITLKKTLSLDLRDENFWKVREDLLRVLETFVEVSQEFCASVAGFQEFLAALQKVVIDGEGPHLNHPKKTKKREDKILSSSLSILANCAKEEPTMGQLKEESFVKVVEGYMVSSENKARLCAIDLWSALNKIDDDVTKCFVRQEVPKYLETELRKVLKMSNKAQPSDSKSGNDKEITGISNQPKNTGENQSSDSSIDKDSNDNRLKLMQVIGSIATHHMDAMSRSDPTTIVPALVELLRIAFDNGDEGGAKHILKILLQMTFNDFSEDKDKTSENKEPRFNEVIKNNKELVDMIRKKMDTEKGKENEKEEEEKERTSGLQNKDDKDTIFDMCQRFLWQLSDFSLDTGSPSTTRQSSGEPSRNKGHIMVSYAWKQQKTIRMIVDGLRTKKNMEVWFDVDHMSGNMLQKMAEAVENCSVFLLAMSTDYNESYNCRLEAEYATKCQKPIIALNMQKSYRPGGWLGLIQGYKKYHDFSDDKFNLHMKELIKEIEEIWNPCGEQDVLNMTSPDTDQKPTDTEVTNTAGVPKSPQSTQPHSRKDVKEPSPSSETKTDSDMTSPEADLKSPDTEKPGNGTVLLRVREGQYLQTDVEGVSFIIEIRKRENNICVVDPGLPQNQSQHVTPQVSSEQEKDDGRGNAGDNKKIDKSPKVEGEETKEKSPEPERVNGEEKHHKPEEDKKKAKSPKSERNKHRQKRPKPDNTKDLSQSDSDTDLDKVVCSRRPRSKRKYAETTAKLLPLLLRDWAMREFRRRIESRGLKNLPTLKHMEEDELLFLCQMYMQAPDSFYRVLTTQLRVTSLKEIAAVSLAVAPIAETLYPVSENHVTRVVEVKDVSVPWWRKDRVAQWLMQHSLYHLVPLRHLSGSQLVVLKTLKHQSPETFYQCLTTQLQLTSPRHIVKVIKAIDRLPIYQLAKCDQIVTLE